MSDTNVVLETGMDDAVSYTKGCYVGQEIIARIHWRGHVAKRLADLSRRGRRERSNSAVRVEIRDAAVKILAASRPRLFAATGARRRARPCQIRLLAPGRSQHPRRRRRGARGARRRTSFVRGGWHASPSAEQQPLRREGRRGGERKLLSREPESPQETDAPRARRRAQSGVRAGASRLSIIHSFSNTRASPGPHRADGAGD